MKFKDLSPESKLFFLTKEQLENLFKDYYDNKLKISEIIKKYRLPINGSIEKHLPHIYSKTECMHCNIPMLLKPSHRDSYANEPCCSDCNHQDTIRCRCNNCEEKREEERQKEKEKRKNIFDTYIEKAQTKKVPFSKLTIEELITLGVFIKYLASDNLEYLVPFGNIIKPKTYKTYLGNLIKNGILLLHPENDLDLIEFKKSKFGEDVIKYDRKDVYWILNVNKDELSHSELLKYFALSKDYLNLDPVDVLQFFKKIVIDESFEYLNYYTNIALDIELERSIKIEETLGELAELYSISQIYNIIYGRISYTGTYCKEHYLKINHTINLLLKNITNFKEKALANKWEVKHFNKPKYLNESIITNFFFNNILNVGEQGYRLTMQELSEKIKE